MSSMHHPLVDECCKGPVIICLGRELEVRPELEKLACFNTPPLECVQIQDFMHHFHPPLRAAHLNLNLNSLSAEPPYNKLSYISLEYKC